MEGEPKQSMEHLEATARVKVQEAVSLKMQGMFNYLKESPLWNNTTAQIR